MGRISLCLFTICCVCCCGVYSTELIFTEPVDNLKGCEVFRLKNESQDMQHHLIQPWMYPLLNCSGTTFGRMEFNISAVPSDICDMLFQFAVLKNVSLNGLDTLPRLQGIYIRKSEVSFDQSESLTAGSPNTSVDTVIISDTSLQVIPNQFLKGLPKLSNLVLSHNKLSSLNDEDFSGLLSLKSLNLEHNNLTGISPDWLRSIPDLKFLDLRATGQINVPQGYHNAENLELLDLSDNFIERLDGDSFLGASGLKTLLLSNNRISAVHENAFRGIRDIQFIDLTANKIERIQSNVFVFFYGDGLTVNIWENPVHCDGPWKWLPEWIEERRERGSYPDIRMRCSNPAKYHGRRLSTMAPSDFKSEDVAPWEECINRVGEVPKGKSNNVTETPEMSTTSLTTSLHFVETTTRSSEEESRIFLSACPSRCRCFFSDGYEDIRYDDIPYPVVDCTRAQYTSTPTDIPDQTRSLILRNNMMKKFDFAFLSQLRKLHLLVLDYNLLSEITCSLDYCVMESLSLLSASNNLFIHISPELFGNFPNLSHVFVHNNFIERFPGNLFANNRQLETLFLGPNRRFSNLPSNLLGDILLEVLVLRGLRLKRIPTIIRDQSNMEMLDLSDNSITSVSADDFQGCHALIELVLEHNRISTIGPGAFSHLPNVRSVDLSENRLEGLNRSVFHGVSHSLRHIELWENPFRCDKTLLWLKDWIFLLESMDPSTEMRFRCHQPARVHGKTSDELHQDDFRNDPSDNDYKEFNETEREFIYSRKDLAVAIICTILVTLVAAILFKCAVSRIPHRYIVSYRTGKLGDGRESLTIAEDL